jgi:gamma-glutamylcyclotransferase (GGCT)/AIG2-like uncharacterized protein YtfP
MSKHFVFIYGTLRRGCAGSMPIRFPNAKFIAAAKVSGSLYDLGPYPGLRLDEANSTVVGEVYEVDDELLKELDEFEVSSNYVRRQADVAFDGQQTNCWTYEPNAEFYRFDKLITSGDWIEYAEMKKDHDEKSL